MGLPRAGHGWFQPIPTSSCQFHNNLTVGHREAGSTNGKMYLRMNRKYWSGRGGEGKSEKQPADSKVRDGDREGNA